MKKIVKLDDFKFLEKIINVSDQVTIKRVSSKDKVFNVATSIHDSSSVIVQSTKLTPIFDLNGEFKFRDVKYFLKAVNEYGEMEEDENNFIFTSGKKKLTFRKTEIRDEGEISNFLKNIDLKTFVSIPLSFNDIKNIRNGLKNKISDKVFFLVKDGKLILKIGHFLYENLYEEEIVDVNTNESIEFITGIKYLSDFFNSLDENSEFTLYLKKDSNFIFIEKGSDIYVKTIIAPIDSNNINN